VIWKVTPNGTATQWVSSSLLLGNPANPAVVIAPFGATGIAFDKHKRNAYVANLDYGAIVKIPVDRDGVPGAPTVFAQSALLVGADGIAFDKDGTLWVGVNVQDRIATVSPSGTVSEVMQGGILDGPSSVVFGTQPHDKRTVYISNFAISRALGIQSGTPHPALLSLPVGIKGLPLP
jgi:sugar lactone lactonase YvrE